MTMVEERVGTVSITKLHPFIGAEVRGVDLSRPLDAAALREIKDAWHEHAVLVFRDQNLTEDDQRRFASYFGPIAKRVPPPKGSIKVNTVAWDDMMMITDHVDKDGKPVGSLGHGEMYFHTDKCYHRRPHRATFLYGIEIPSEGGHTIVLEHVCRLRQSAAGAEAAAQRRDGDAGLPIRRRQAHQSQPQSEGHPHCAQPIFLTNPGSGRKGLYVATLNTMWIEGMDPEESEGILLEMFDIVEDPSIIYEHDWRVGDLVMWDNLACLHARTDWPQEQTRTLRRCTVEGEPLY